MVDHPESTNGYLNPSVKYEGSDLPLRGVLGFAGGLVVVLVVVSVGIYFLIPAVLGPTPQPAPFTSNREGPWEDWDKEGASSAPVSQSRLPPPPELEEIDQTNPAAEGGRMHTRVIGDQVREEEALLSGYGWVDKGKGIAHIPIDEAMRRLGGEPGAGVVAGPPAPGQGLSAVSASGRRDERGGKP